jgi:hypothetical protein
MSYDTDAVLWAMEKVAASTDLHDYTVLENVTVFMTVCFFIQGG